MTLNTPEDWWGLVDDAWDALGDCALLTVKAPSFPDDGPGRFEDSRLNVAASTFWERMTQAKKDRDHKTVWLGLEMIWEGAPDNGSIHLWPRWGDLCDLCSEVWVFNPPEDDSDFLMDEAAF